MHGQCGNDCQCVDACHEGAFEIVSWWRAFMIREAILHPYPQVALNSAPSPTPGQSELSRAMPSSHPARTHAYCASPANAT
ncbi:hypothetical protein VTO73DRAFT_4570 [Trametes versicolor]